ncbi:MAG: outer membrane protein assembly factor BamE [Campylobacteraceae bacterium]
MKFSKLVASVIFAGLVGIVFSGCVQKSGSMGIQDISVHEIDAKMKKGKTTQTDVQQLYGNPTKKSLDQNGNEQWVYEYSETKRGVLEYVGLGSGVSDGYKKSLTLKFNRKTKLLTDYYVLEEGAKEYQQAIGDGSSHGAGVK